MLTYLDRIHKQPGRQAGRQTGRDRHTERHTERHADTDAQTQTLRHTDTHTCVYIYIHLQRLSFNLLPLRGMKHGTQLLSTTAIFILYHALVVYYGDGEASVLVHCPWQNGELPIVMKA